MRSNPHLKLMLWIIITLLSVESGIWFLHPLFRLHQIWSHWIMRFLEARDLTWTTTTTTKLNGTLIMKLWCRLSIYQWSCMNSKHHHTLWLSPRLITTPQPEPTLPAAWASWLAGGSTFSSGQFACGLLSLPDAR
jgi:hypothetical protein